MLLITALAFGVLWIFYKFWTSNNKYWEKRGVPSYPASFPYGSDPNLVIFKEYRGYSMDKMYKKLASHPFFGIIVLRKPMLVMRDPEYIRMILTKEFSHFRDRHIFDFSEDDALSQHLFNLDGEKWRALRVKLTPTFTSGRMKSMFPLFVSCAESFSSLLLTKLGSKADIKELTGRYTTDVICSCAFGLETDAINHPDNKLREIGMSRINLSVLTTLKVSIVRIFPQMTSLFSIRFNPKEHEKYLIDIVKNTIEHREKNGIKRNDFLDLLIQLKNKGTIGDDTKEGLEQPFEMTIPFMAAQCFVFFLAGFETSSSVQSFCLYELALHQEMQSRLREEIDKAIEKHGSITYEAIQEMEYLDMVINETMRKYPTLPNLVRRCNKTFTTPSGHKIETGTSIIIPVWSLHHDPQYFADPEKFDPERFSEENKSSIQPYTFLPFGEGPRMCIGMRFGLLQTKMGIVTFLRNFMVEPCEDTKIPLEIGGYTATTCSKDPITLKIVARSK